MNLHEYVKELKLNKILTQKQCVVIENLYIYFEDLMVYRIVIAIHPDMLKKAKKLGLETTSGYITLSDERTPRNKLKISEYNVEMGRYIAIYNPNNAECTIFTGEE